MSFVDKAAVSLVRAAFKAKMRRYMRKGLPVVTMRNSDNREVTLMGMRHVSPVAVFEAQVRFITRYPRGDVFLEGVDMSGHEHYDRFKRLYPLARDLVSSRRHPVGSQADYVKKSMGTIADIDITADDYSESLNDIGNMLNKLTLFLELLVNGGGVHAFLDVDVDNLMDIDKGFVVDARNRVLVDNVLASDSPRVIAPWGAGHLPGITSLLEESGWHVVNEQVMTWRGDLVDTNS